MPVRPSPMTYRCPSCGWSKTTAPKSDALLPGEFFTKCPSIDDLDGMCAVVLALTGADFYKSMTTHADHRVS